LICKINNQIIFTLYLWVKINAVSLQRFKRRNNEQKLFTYPSTRYYYSLAAQVEVSLVCSKIQ